ncbi:MAG: RNA-binding protein [Myxococcota bacterium]
MGKKLYIGNIPFSTTEPELREMFQKHGALESVNVITDRETGRSRGFAFVEFADESSARAAQEALDGTEMGGRSLRVNEANDRGRGGPRGGGGGSRGGYGRDRY